MASPPLAPRHVRADETCAAACVAFAAGSVELAGAASLRRRRAFLKDTLIHLGLVYVPFAMIVIVGASNAVNLTDGLDGLAIVPVMIVAACFGLIAYLAGTSISPATSRSTMFPAPATWR